MFNDCQTSYTCVLQSGETAVHLAAENGYEDVMQKLMKCGVKLDDVDKEGKTALHFAAGKGHASVVEMLLAAGLNVNAVTDVCSAIYSLCSVEEDMFFGIYFYT